MWLLVFVIAYAVVASAVAFRSPRHGALLAALGAFASNAYLFSRKWESARATESACNIDATFNCDKVNLSEWSMAFGIPITLLGMGFYAGLAIASLVREEDSRRFYQLNLLFAVVNLLYSAFLGYQSWQLGAACVLCMAIYAANALLLATSVAGIRAHPGPWDPMELGTSREFVTIALSFVFVVAVGGIAFKAQQAGSVAEQVRSGVIDDETLAMLYTQPCGTVEVDGTEPTLGPPSAAYHVVEWADYGCSHCAEASAHFKPFLAENRDVKLAFKVFALTGDCNPAIPDSRGPERCNAAYAAECARPQGKYFPMSQMLFDNQGYFAPGDLEFMANQVGLDVGTWKACLVSEATAASVMQDGVAGERAGVRGTPSLYLKGTHGDSWVLISGGVEPLKAVIDAHRSGRPMPPPGPCPPMPQH